MSDFTAVNDLEHTSSQKPLGTFSRFHFSIDATLLVIYRIRVKKGKQVITLALFFFTRI